MNQNVKRRHRAYKAPAASADAEAALYFIGGQYLLHARDGRAEMIKFLSPGLVKKAFTGASVDSGWLSTETVRYGTCSQGDYVINYYPPSRRRLLIASDDGQALSALTVPLPGLVFAGLDRRWFIWAVRARRFTPDLELFQAPLPNTDSALICFGENPDPEVRKHGASTAWELFISSPFNEHNANGKSRKYSQNILLQLSSLHERKAARYPLRDLVSVRSTINQEVNRLIGD
jgi:PRTRC genetic system protein B